MDDYLISQQGSIAIEPLSTYERVAAEVTRLHTQQQDLDEGDLLNRLDRYTAYVFKKIRVTDLDLFEFALCEDVVAEYAALYLATGTYPPIVYDEVDRSIVDGLHRANALARCGLAEIDAFVGTDVHLNENWIPDDE